MTLVTSAHIPYHPKHLIFREVPTRLDGRWFESILFHIITFLTKYSIDVRGYGLICCFYKRHGFFLFLC